MKHHLKQNMPVLTADEYRLGQTHTVYHREEPDTPDFNSYLMVVNMTIGDEFYVPMTYIDEARDDETAVWLTLTHDDIKEKQLTRLPQFVVKDQFTEEQLPDAGSTPERGKPLDDVVPLPPNLSAEENKTK